MNAANPSSALVANASDLSEGLNQRVSAQLQTRLGSSKYYDAKEIARIEACQSALFPSEFSIDEQGYERLRVLCTLSQCGLVEAHSIKSHRPYIGPVIVRVKRFAWKMIKAQLESSFSGIQEFCRLEDRRHRLQDSHAKLLYSHSELQQETEQLKRQIQQLSSK